MRFLIERKLNEEHAIEEYKGVELDMNLDRDWEGETSINWVTVSKNGKEYGEFKGLAAARAFIDKNYEKFKFEDDKDRLIDMINSIRIINNGDIYITAYTDLDGETYSIDDLPYLSKRPDIYSITITRRIDSSDTAGNDDYEFIKSSYSDYALTIFEEDVGNNTLIEVSLLGDYYETDIFKQSDLVNTKTFPVLKQSVLISNLKNKFINTIKNETYNSNGLVKKFSKLLGEK